MTQPGEDRGPPPPRELVLTTPEHLIAFGFGLGLAPVAPGTAGTLLGVPLFLLLGQAPLPVFAGALLVLILFGIWICGESARLLGVHDDPGIVFDEIVGYVVAATPLLFDFGTLHLAWGLLLAFGLFRLFDILKPWPIRWLDRRVGGGFGIMLDDLVAGLFSALLLTGILWLLR